MANSVVLVARSLAVIAASTAATALAALAHTAAALSTAGVAIPGHGRSALYVVGTVAAILVWVGLIVLTRSVSIAVAGGILAGGALANLLSLTLWPSVDGVPNPLVVGEVAFNLADVAVAFGLALVLLSAGVFAVRNRARLGEPVRLSRSAT